MGRSKYMYNLNHVRFLAKNMTHLTNVSMSLLASCADVFGLVTWGRNAWGAKRHPHRRLQIYRLKIAESTPNMLWIFKIFWGHVPRSPKQDELVDSRFSNPGCTTICCTFWPQVYKLKNLPSWTLGVLLPPWPSPPPSVNRLRKCNKKPTGSSSKW